MPGGYGNSALEADAEPMYAKLEQMCLDAGHEDLDSKGPCSIKNTEERAITLVQLKNVIAHVRRRCAKEEWTSTHDHSPIVFDHINLYDLVHWFVKPVTKTKQISYVEFVAAAKQMPTWFVSHWWGEAVADFIACLSQHSKDHKLTADCAYWVCAYANNQWLLAAAVTSDPAESSFAKAMALSVGTVSVVDRGAVTWTRIWCSFEVARSLTAQQKEHRYEYDMYTCYSHGTGDDIKAVGLTEGIAPSDANSSRAKSKREALFPPDIVDRALGVQLQDGQASVKSDKVHILNSIAGNPDLEAEPNLADPAILKLNVLLHGRVACQGLLNIVHDEAKYSRYLTFVGKAPLTSLVICFHDVELTPAMSKQLFAAIPSTVIHIALSYIKHQETLPEEYRKLKKAKSLSVLGWAALKELPEWVGEFEHLQALFMGDCNSLTSLPKSLKTMSHLTKLVLHGSKGLKEETGFHKNTTVKR